MMSGYYLHIPFCKQACIYCDFHFSTNSRGIPEMVNAMLMEMETRQSYLEGEKLSTIYFGGGTPSLLSGETINQFITKINALHTVETDAEITLEANPDDLSAQKLAELKDAGINRLSIGVQSFHNYDLNYLKRAHDAAKALECIKNAQQAGFENITIDLIYGIPGQTDEAWEQNLNSLASLGIPHFSAYALTVEAKTELDFLIKQRKSKPVDEEQTARNFMAMQEWAKKQGYLAYEISNFALEGWIARHNSGYWKGTKYLGIGPSAHSYNGESRQWNIANNALYVKKLNAALPYFEYEELSQEQKFEEYIMTGMRTLWGCNLNEIAERFGNSYSESIYKKVQKYIHAGNAEIEGNIIRLSIKGRLIADHIIADLI